MLHAGEACRRSGVASMCRWYFNGLANQERSCQGRMPHAVRPLLVNTIGTISIAPRYAGLLSCFTSSRGILRLAPGSTLRALQ